MSIFAPATQCLRSEKKFHFGFEWKNYHLFFIQWLSIIMYHRWKTNKKNCSGGPSHTFLRFLTKCGGIFKNKMCNFCAASVKCYWIVGMKIMKFICCYWTQWCPLKKFQVLLAPSSVVFFNFWHRIAWRLKISQNNVVMSILFCEFFSLLGGLCQKLKKSTLDGAKSTWNFF